jgi:hypothetical protein
MRSQKYQMSLAPVGCREWIAGGWTLGGWTLGGWTLGAIISWRRDFYRNTVLAVTSALIQNQYRIDTDEQTMIQHSAGRHP